MRSSSIFISSVAIILLTAFFAIFPSVAQGAEPSIVQFMRDSAMLGFANMMLEKGLEPFSYDNFLEFKQVIASTKSGTISFKNLSAFGQVVPAVGNDPMTFYIDEDLNENIIKKAGNAFLYGWDIIPPDLRPGIGPPPIPGALLWPVPGGSVTDNYGCVPNVVGSTWRGRCGSGFRWHNGLDIARSVRNPVVAAADGDIIGIGFREGKYGYDSIGGNWIAIWHKSLGITTTYNHLSSVAVKRGDAVTKGQPIGNTGATGFVTGDHLHFMVYTETPVFVGTTHTGVTADPYPYLSGQ